MTMLDAALAAQGRGFHIFPVAVGQKVPHRMSSYHGADGQDHGWGETATNDVSRIRHFWTHVDPNANIGVACKPSELLVVDLDLAKTDWNLQGTEWGYLHTAYGARVDGGELFDEMAYKLFDEARDGDSEGDADRYQNTLTVRTGSGGTHLYYRWPAHWPRISQASPVKGLIDVRGNGGQHGGYVLGAGSFTSAGVYSFENILGVALAPRWIRRLVAEKPQTPPIRRPQGIRQPGAVSWSGLVDKVRNAGEGNRNNALLWAARSMYSDGAPESEAMTVLGEAATQAGLGWFEIQRTIQSAYRVQAQKEGPR